MKTKDQKRKEAVSRAKVSWDTKQQWRKYKKWETEHEYLMTFVPKNSTYDDLVRYGVL